MDLSDTGSIVRKLSHFWGQGGREEFATSQYSLILWLTFLHSSPFKIKYSFSVTSYDLDVLCFLLAESVVLTCRVFWGPVFHSIPELSITLEDTVT